jgi:hypothetical protein
MGWSISNPDLNDAQIMVYSACKEFIDHVYFIKLLMLETHICGTMCVTDLGEYDRENLALADCPGVNGDKNPRLTIA